MDNPTAHLSQPRMRANPAWWLPAIQTLLIAYVVIGGVTSLLAYPLDIPRLTDWLNEGISIQPNAALCVIFSGLSLMFLLLRRRALAGASAAIVLLIGGSTLLEWITGVTLGHDGLLLFDREWGRTGVVVPGRMGPPGSLSWTLIGIALLLTAAPKPLRLRGVAPVLSIAPGRCRVRHVEGVCDERRGGARAGAMAGISAIARPEFSSPAPKVERRREKLNARAVS